ncbi:hypothetical protein ABPG72_002487 [Tetrahymena utriculariae]
MDYTDVSSSSCSADSVLKQDKVDILEIEKAERENFDNYQTEAVLGEGTYGRVYKVKYTKNQQSYALKIFKPMNHLQQMYEKEVASLKRVKGYNKFVQIFAQLDQFKEKYKGIVMEFCKGGELLKYIMVNKGLDEENVRSLLHQIVDILKTLQSLNLAHLDIKAENFFLDSNFDLILGDFGMCEELISPNQVLNNYRKGSPSYQIFELYKQIPYRAFDADIFAAGVTIFSMYSCLLPFKQFQSYGILFSNPAQFWTLMRKNSPNPAFQDNLSKDFVDLFMKMVHPHHDKRITLEQIEQHPFYIGANSQQISPVIVMNNINNTQNTFNAGQNNKAEGSEKALYRGIHSMSISEEFEKYEYDISNLKRERKPKVYNEQYGKLNDFSTNVDCETLFKFLFVKQEEFTSEIPILSDKSYKLKCIYKYSSAQDKIQIEFSDLQVNYDACDESIQEIFKDFNFNSNQNNEENALHFNISLQTNSKDSKTYVLFTKKQGDSFEFFKHVAAIQELIKTFN